MIGRTLRAYLALLALLALAWGVLRALPNVRVEGVPDIRESLPAHLGEWRGAGIWFCQNERCLRSYTEDRLGPPGTNGWACQACGQPLYERSLGEKRGLPADVVLLKRQYTHPSGRQALASVVISGLSRKGIHRPEDCMVGQGHTIPARRVIAIERPGRAPLDVMVMEMATRQLGGGAPSYSYYAYWFAGGGRETPHHLTRLAHTIWERFARGEASRWAYIAVAGRRLPDDPAYLDEVRELIGLLEPALRKSAGTQEPSHAADPAVAAEKP